MTESEPCHSHQRTTFTCELCKCWKEKDQTGKKGVNLVSLDMTNAIKVQLRQINNPEQMKRKIILLFCRFLESGNPSLFVSSANIKTQALKLYQQIHG